jgi:hypothetical protein
MSQIRTITFHIYHPDGKVEDKSQDWDGNFRSIRGMINETVGGTLEHVAVLHNGRRADMFVEGDGAGVLPPNPNATAIYRNNTLKRSPSTKPSSLPQIYGVAILFDQLVWS